MIELYVSSAAKTARAGALTLAETAYAYLGDGRLHVYEIDVTKSWRAGSGTMKICLKSKLEKVFD